MSKENNANKQNVTNRHGPDPRFVWGVVAVIILGGLFYGGYVKYKELSDKLEQTQAKLDQTKVELTQTQSELTQTQNNLTRAHQEGVKKFDSNMTELEQSGKECEDEVEKLSVDKSNLEIEVATLKSYPGARRICRVNIDKDNPNKTVSFAFRWCPPGTFMMGSPDTEEGREDIETRHKVTLTKGFWMLETEVTVGMFKAFVNDTKYKSVGDKPKLWKADNNVVQDDKISWQNPGFNQSDNHPVTCVSWDDSDAFCKWLSNKTGFNIQLPTEAQWEYACRAGTDGRFADELSDIAWYYNKEWITHAVGKKKANRWGLYDMHGNVGEWCQDWYDKIPTGDVTDPMSPSTGKMRIFRGGSISCSPEYCRSARRGRIIPNERISVRGFRVALIP